MKKRIWEIKLIPIDELIPHEETDPENHEKKKQRIIADKCTTNQTG